MSSRTDRRILWLPIVGGLAVLIGFAVMVFGGVLALEARSDREDAEAAVARQQEAIALAEQELTTAEHDLEAADEDNAAAVGDLGESEAQRSDNKAALDLLRAEIPAFVAAVAGVVEDVGDVYPAICEAATQRRAQIETLLADDYAAFNALRLQYVEAATSVAGRLEGFSSQMESLPQVAIGDPYLYDGP
ncbi:MAG: hypothetical protein U9O63_08470, partial [Actinomycetota bacterium]|nr:hypothetical protein [Actinomycetota bacterium]